MARVLTEDIACEQLDRLFDKNNAPLVILGTGASCAVDKAFGMQALRCHLKKKISIYKLEGKQKQQWERVIEDLNNDIDFESAMNSVIDEELLKIIVKETASLLINKEKQIAFGLLTGRIKWPAIGFFKFLLSKRINDALHVVTTNYDCLAEYAFTSAGIPYITGYSYGICGKLDWIRAHESMASYGKLSIGRKTDKRKHYTKHICLYKIHGSLNTFKSENDIIEINSLMYMDELPEEVKRFMITPGTSKYEELLTGKSALLERISKLRNEHNFFVFIGFGFNDSHIINSDIKNKLMKKGCPAVLLTKAINNNIKKYMKSCENLWTVYSAGSGNGTNIYNCKYDNVLLLKRNYWEADKFCKKFLGG